MKLWKAFKKHTTEIIVIVSFTLVLIFSIVVLLFNRNSLEVSDTLIEWFYKFFGLELLALSGIKISKHVGSAFGKLEDMVDGMVDDEDEEIDDEDE